MAEFFSGPGGGPAFSDSHDFADDNIYSVPAGEQSYGLYVVVLDDLSSTIADIEFYDSSGGVTSIGTTDTDDIYLNTGTGGVCHVPPSVIDDLSDIRIDDPIPVKIWGFDT